MKSIQCFLRSNEDICFRIQADGFSNGIIIKISLVKF